MPKTTNSFIESPYAQLCKLLELIEHINGCPVSMKKSLACDCQKIHDSIKIILINLCNDYGDSVREETVREIYQIVYENDGCSCSKRLEAYFSSKGIDLTK